MTEFTCIAWTIPLIENWKLNKIEFVTYYSFGITVHMPSSYESPLACMCNKCGCKSIDKILAYENI